jgi:TolB-like protein/DNA-binding winged helix-turn-helix (wHTH) protein
MTSGADSGISASHSFGRWRFDANTGDLLDGASSTRLEPQVAKLLDYFLRHQNTLISRDELMAAVWENRIVSDDAINRCISILRQILSPDEKNAFIETVVRRGFVGHFPAPPAEPAPTEQRPRRRNYVILAALAAVAAIIAYGAFRSFPDSPPQAPETKREGTPVVAVLPFVSTGLADDTEFFANGMHDDLLTQLAQLQSLRVISRTSVLGYRDSQRNIREIGRELGADAILEGGVQRVGDQIRFNVQLIDARSDGHLWAQQYDRELSPANIFEVQAEIARAIVAALRAALTEQDVTQLRVLPTENMAAYRAYRQAMEIRSAVGFHTPEYILALEEAVAVDPEFVRAWAELAGALSFANIARQEPASIQRVEQILEHIRSLAPNSAEYLIAQAYYTYYLLKDNERAYDLIKQAQILRPSDVWVVELKSWIERRRGDHSAKIESVRLARTLDPKNPLWTVMLANSLAIDHQYDEASQVIEHSAMQNFELAALRGILRLRDDPDRGRPAEDLAALEKEYGVIANPEDRWDAHIASRDYAAAEEFLNAVEAAGEHEHDWRIDIRFSLDVSQVVTYWFLRASDRLEPLLAQGRSYLDASRNANGDFQDNNQYLVMAFVTAAEGNREETERLIRHWRREAGKDLAELVNLRHQACRALGMAAATSAAVECIRAGLAAPSLVMPFVEPYLPYYDSMRNEAEFVDLLAEIQNQ